MEERTIDEMKLDILKWQLEDADEVATKEYEELCKERPREFGEGHFKIKLATYKCRFYKVMHEELVQMISKSGSEIMRLWEQEKAKRQQDIYAE